ncbi:hypothetical protein N9D31_02110 [Oligoflexaceae bacterium]|nr:hypothetical protein [Oligoflexaceae bacterium]
MKDDKKFKNSTLFLSDIFVYTVSLGPVIIALYTCWSLRGFSESLGFLFFCLLPLVFCLSFILSIFAIRLLLPKLKPGKYDVGLNINFIAWALHLALSRSADFLGLRYLIFQFNTLKYLYFRSLGGQISFDLTCSLQVEMTDFQLIAIKPGCIITTGAFLSGHIFFKDKLILQTVTLEEDVYVGANTWISGSKIGKGAHLGIHNIIFRRDIPEGEVVENFKYQKGNDLDGN